MKRIVRSAYNATSDISARDILYIISDIDDIVRKFEGILLREDISDLTASNVLSAKHHLEKAISCLDKG